jgi:hypothetical protein
MTETAFRTRAGIAARISAWARHRRHELSVRIYAAADDRARRYGWTVTETTGRFGFERRSYRDPRFDARRQRLASEANLRRTCSEAAPTREAGE